MDPVVINAIRDARRIEKVNGIHKHVNNRPNIIEIYFHLDNNRDIYDRQKDSFYSLVLEYDNTNNILSSLLATYRYIPPYSTSVDIKEEESYIMLSTLGIPIPNDVINRVNSSDTPIPIYFLMIARGSEYREDIEASVYEGVFYLHRE